MSRRSKVIKGVLVGGSVLAGLSAQPAKGALISEQFNYGGTSLNTQDGGFGFNGAWVVATGAINLSNDGISLANPAAGFPVAGSRATGAVASTATRVLADDSQVSLVTAGTFYMSVLVRKDDAGAFQVELFGGSNTRWRVGINALDQVVAGVSSNAVSTTLIDVDDQTLLFVARLAVEAAPAVDVGRTKLFRATDPIPGSDFFGTTFDATQSSNSSAINTSIRLNVTAGNVEFDEIRIGTSYTDVVPEPSCIAIAAIGAGGLLARRRQRV